MAKTFEQKIEALKNVLRNAPRELAVMARNHFEESFDKQGYNETPFQKWKERANPNNRRNKGRAILIQSGRLSRSIRIISVTKTKITIGSDVPYAKIHNEGNEIIRRARSEIRPRRRARNGQFSGGFEQQGRGATFSSGKITIPKRQFLGKDNKLLAQKINQYFQSKVKQVFN